MTSNLQKLQVVIFRQAALAKTRSYVTGGPGSGVGKGGGGGGTIREAGGAFGVMEAAREGQYFHKKNREQLMNLKNHLQEQIEFHEEAIKRHAKAIADSKEHAKELEKHTKH